jgi:hypothetical protein
VLCDYLVVRGHLWKDGARYRLTLRLYLTRSSTAFVGSAVEFFASDAMIAAFSRLRPATTIHWDVLSPYAANLCPFSASGSADVPAAVMAPLSHHEAPNASHR